MALDEPAGRALRCPEIGRLGGERAPGLNLEHPRLVLSERGTALLHPRRVELGQQRPLEDLEARAGRRAGPVDVALGKTALSLLCTCGRLLYVDRGAVSEVEPELVAAFDPASPEDAAEPGKDGAQGGVRRGGWPGGPQGVYGLVAPHRAAAVQGQVSEERAALSSRKLIIEAMATDIYAKGPAQMNGHRLGGADSVFVIVNYRSDWISGLEDDHDRDSRAIPAYISQFFLWRLVEHFADLSPLCSRAGAGEGTRRAA